MVCVHDIIVHMLLVEFWWYTMRCTVNIISLSFVELTFPTVSSLGRYGNQAMYFGPNNNEVLAWAKASGTMSVMG